MKSRMNKITHTKISEKLLEIVKEIDYCGSANLTKLTVLKKWFERPERLSAFALWIASRAVSCKDQITGESENLFLEAQVLLSGLDKFYPKVDRKAAEILHDHLKNFQNNYENQQWGPVRLIYNWNLMLVEHGLAIYLWHLDTPRLGYKLAAAYCRHFDSHHYNDLNGPSRGKVDEIVQFVTSIEALEDEPGGSATIETRYAP